MNSLLCRLFCFCAVWCALTYATFADPIGSTYVAGRTWCDLQHNGSSGRTIVVDDSGRATLVWTNMLNDGMSRHVYTNQWNPGTGRFSDSTGWVLDNTVRAGYATVGLASNGCVVPAFGQTVQGSGNVAVSLCGLTPIILPLGTTAAPSSPMIAISHDTTVLLMAAFTSATGSMQYGFSRGIIQLDDGGTPWNIRWDTLGGDFVYMMDTTHSMGYAVADGPDNMVARAWVHPRSDVMWDNDIFVQESETTGEDWNSPYNVTFFAEPDWDCQSGDTAICNRDTLRAFNDLDLIIDSGHHSHIAFTTVGYYVLNERVTLTQGMIWHWSNEYEIFSLVADGWINAPRLGTFETIVQRPSLVRDPSTNYLYCAYMRFDTSTYTEAGYPSADIYISVSTDLGQRWSVGTNVTRTTPQSHPVPAGQSLCERDPSLAQQVTYENGMGYLHLQYLLDRDAGCALRNEGVVTLNDVIYQRIPVDSITTTPLMPNYPLHHDSTGFLASKPEHPLSPHPLSLRLSSYPNPFNSTTVLRYELPKNGHVELKVYDVLGREAAVLQRSVQDAGEHVAVWNAHGVSSGIYFVTLRANGQVRTQKIMLLK